MTLTLFAVTPLFFFIFKWQQKYFNSPINNPILLSICAIIATLYFCDISYQTYQIANKPFSLLLEFAIVALAIPLYNEFINIKKAFFKIFICVAAGVTCSSSMAMIIAYSLDAAPQIIASVAPNAVTTPIAISVSQQLGGIPALSAVIVICVGILGSMFAIPLMHKINGNNNVANGLALGTACHAIGTAKALEHSETMGAYASISLILSTVLTPFILPITYSLFTLALSLTGN